MHCQVCDPELPNLPPQHAALQSILLWFWSQPPLLILISGFFSATSFLLWMSFLWLTSGVCEVFALVQEAGVRPLKRGAAAELREGRETQNSQAGSISEKWKAHLKQEGPNKPIT